MIEEDIEIGEIYYGQGEGKYGFVLDKYDRIKDLYKLPTPGNMISHMHITCHDELIHVLDTSLCVRVYNDHYAGQTEWFAECIKMINGYPQGTFDIHCANIKHIFDEITPVAARLLNEFQIKLKKKQERWAKGEIHPDETWECNFYRLTTGTGRLP